MKSHYSYKLALVLAAVALASPAQAYTYDVRLFGVITDLPLSGVSRPYDMLSKPTYFIDNFANDLAPPNDYTLTYSDGTQANYLVTGTVVEHNKLTLDSSGAVPNSSGTPVQVVTLATDITSDPTKGLKAGASPFVVGGVFDLINPGNGTGSYGVHLSDAVNGIGNDIVSLTVRGTTNGGAVVSFQRSVATASGVTTTVLEQIPIETNYLLIALAVGYDDFDGNGSKEAGAGFFYWDGPNTVYHFNTTTDLFHGEDWTRAAFFAADSAPLAAVPEPGTYAMLLAGLGLVGWAAQHKRV